MDQPAVAGDPEHMGEPLAGDPEHMGKPQAAGAASSAPSQSTGGHLRLLHAALSVADSARREAEQDNARLREELAALQEHLALVLARSAAARFEVANENCGASVPPADALSRRTPVCSDVAASMCVAGAPEARRPLVPAPRPDEALGPPDADNASAAREELLRRRAAALGLPGSALFPKAMHRV